MKKILSLPMFGFAVFLAGCTSEPTSVTVKGKVTLDNAPVEKGLVQFVPLDGKTPSSKGGVIQNGEFTAEVYPGEVRVEITAPKVVGKRKLYDTPDSPTEDIIEELIPNKYNTESTLTRTIKAKEEALTFELKSKESK